MTNHFVERFVPQPDFPMTTLYPLAYCYLRFCHLPDTEKQATYTPFVLITKTRLSYGISVIAGGQMTR